MNRFYSLFFILCLSALTIQLHAQNAQNVILSGKLAPPSTDKMMCNNAGTIQIGQLIGQSNDNSSSDPIFLCLGDSLEILHDGNFDVSMDPVPGTLGGVGYAFYNCQPTVDGPDLVSITGDAGMGIMGDPCITQENNPTGGLYVFTGGTRSGDVFFVNDGGLQAFFNPTTNAPIQFFFAPITYDNLRDTILFGQTLFFAEYEGNPTGSCVNVGVDQAFSVVYLNPVAASNVQNTTANGSCSGSFLIQGGLPEFDPLEDYIIDISLQSDPSVKGSIIQTPNHNETVEFNVPQPGTYVITVEDGKSCGTSFTVDMAGCQAVSFSLPLINALPAENICVPVTVENFNDVAGVQMTITWDDNVLMYTGVQNFHPNLPDLALGSFANPQPDALTLSYFSAFDASVPDGGIMFEICFTVVGSLGTTTPLDFNDLLTNIEVSSNANGLLGFIGNDGQINVTDQPLFVLAVQDSVSCADTDDGSFTLTLASGTAPYQFTYRPIPSALPPSAPQVIGQAGGSLTVDNLTAGEYELVIQDSSVPMNMVTDTVEVLAGPDLTLRLDALDTQCFGDSTGVAIAVLLVNNIVTDPTDDYTFSWMCPMGVDCSVNNDSLINVPAGSYSVMVTDPQGCTANASGGIATAAPLIITSNNTTINSATCSGSMDGSIQVVATGGTPDMGNFQYDWSSGQSDNAPESTLSNLDPGTYTVTVTDNNGCEFENDFIVNAVKTLEINGVITDVSCNGLTDGNIFATGTTLGGAPAEPYTFNWSGGTANNTNNTSDVTGLAPGTYFVTMTDSDPVGCEIIDSFLVNEPEVLMVGLADLVNETCIVGNDGSAALAVTGGTFPYSYDWTNMGMPIGQTDSVITNLSQGTYDVEVTDDNNCMETFSVVINAPTPPTILPITDDNLECSSDSDGSLNVEVVALGDPTYMWSNGASTQSIDNLTPGTYIVTVTDENFCFSVDSAFVIAPPPLAFTDVVPQSPDCPGFSNGQITLIVEGGTAPYAFEWSTNPGVQTTLNPLPGLEAGTYGVTVTDANDCPPIEQSIDVLDPPSIEVSFATVTGVSCPDDVTCNGTASVTANYSDMTSGTFTFTWSSGESDVAVSSSVASMLCRGDQTLTVSDGVCGVDSTFNVPSPDEISVEVMSENVSCNGEEDGSISLTPSGGTAPYNIFWVTTSETGNTISNLSAQNYEAVITDNNGCTQQQIVQIQEPDELILSIDDSQTTPTVSCAGDSDGILAVIFNANDQINDVGSNPYTWANNIAPSTSNIASGLPAGSYSVTLTDVKGCQATLDYTISEPTPIVLELLPITPPPCFGDQTVIIVDTIFGGAGVMISDYTYEVDNSGVNPASFPTPVFGGPHIVTVFDPLGCSTSTDIFIDEPAQLVVTLPNNITVELGDTTTQIIPVIDNSIPIDNYIWTPGDFLSSDTIRSPFVVPERNLEYTLTVIDENGCTDSDIVFVELDVNRNFYIPNAFSPNGDGINDSFRAYGCLGVRNIKSVSIYDRWGDLLFRENDLGVDCFGGTKLWDGRFVGTQMNPGVFVYVLEVEFLDNQTLIYRGDITLLR